jgi:uncharacterized Fe-S cluster-containing radical SAM superfamily protein
MAAETDDFAVTPGIEKAHSIVHGRGPGYWMTDLTKTSLEDVKSRYFRLFTPVKLARGRLPTSLPEFRSLRHEATLSDSPLTTAAKLGGHWSDHNLAAITHVGACNFRCKYCYVSFAHLSGRDGFPGDAVSLVSDYLRARRALADSGKPLTILRISGGEPLLAPGLVSEVYRELDQRSLLGECILKVESNLSALPYSYRELDLDGQASLRKAAPHVTLHATLHARPHERDWPQIRDGLRLALEMGFDLYPAIGGTGWSVEDLQELASDLESAARNLSRRVAVRPFRLSYATRYGRRVTADNNQPEGVAASVAWEGILRQVTGSEYLATPRHEVELT